MTNEILLEKATEAMKRSYSPYSKFSVGAALLTSNGKVYTGFNIENSSYSATVCAERTAVFSAILSGEKEFLKLAVVGSSSEEIKNFCYPCGVCRQVLSEFCNDSLEIILFNGKEIKHTSLGELLPMSFGSENLC